MKACVILLVLYSTSSGCCREIAPSLKALTGPQAVAPCVPLESHRLNSCNDYVNWTRKPRQILFMWTYFKSFCSVTLKLASARSHNLLSIIPKGWWSKGKRSFDIWSSVIKCQRSFDWKRRATFKLGFYCSSRIFHSGLLFVICVCDLDEDVIQRCGSFELKACTTCYVVQI